jgi:CHAT domain-containing protein
MLFHEEDDNRIKRFLLGEVTAEEEAQIEDRLFADATFVQQLGVVEQELIDDYLCDRLTAEERARFEKHFLATRQRPEQTAQTDARREQLLLMKALKRYAVETQKSSQAPAGEQVPDLLRRLRALAQGWWQVPVFALLLVGLGFGVRAVFFQESEVERVTEYLNQAYRAERPLEARITGLGYAPFTFSVLRGERPPATTENKVNYVALEQARHFLFSRKIQASDHTLLYALGKYYLAQKEFDQAIDQLRQALPLNPSLATLHSDLGAALLGKIARDRSTKEGPSKQDVNACFEHLNRALALDPALLEALFNRALLNQFEQLRREAQADWERYLQQDSHSPWAKEAQQNLAQVKRDLGKGALRREQLLQDFRDALAARADERLLSAFNLSFSFNGNYIAEQLINDFLAARLAARAHDAEAALRALTYVGELAAQRQGERFFADLARYYRQLQPTQLPLLVAARKLMAEANAHYRKSENDRAVEVYEEARQLFAQAGNTGEELFAVAWIGHCHHQRSDTERNLEVFTWLAPVCSEKAYRWMHSNALCGLANGYNSAGQFSQAIAACLQCGNIASDFGDQTGVLRSWYMLGAFYFELGKHEENIRLTERGLELGDRIAAELRYTITFYNLRAWSLSALGLREAAFAFQREAVRIAHEAGSPRLIAYAQIFQGQVFAQHQRFTEAIASTQRGVALGQQLNDETGRDFAHLGLLYLGNIYRAAGQYAEALAAFDQVRGFYQQSKKQIYRYGAAKGRLLTLIAQKRDDTAQQELGEVLALYEQYRRHIQEESNRNSFFDQEQSVYDVAIDFAYTRLNEPRQALAYAELSRSRSLLDILKRGAERIQGPEYPEFLLEAKTEPLGIEAIQSQLPADTQVLEFAVLADKVIGWVFTASGFRHAPIVISAAELRKRIDQYLPLIERAPGKADERWREPAVELHDLLIQPFTRWLDPQKRLCIVADKTLTRLPFGSLVARATGRCLIEDYPLSYASSANVFLVATAEARKKAAPGAEYLLAVGNPRFDRRAFPLLEDLPTAADEATHSAAYYPAALVLQGERATKQALLRELGRADVIHLAAHYVPDSWSPMFSHIPLATLADGAEESTLQVHELSRLGALRARLVILSACRTLGEEYYAGEGAIGAARAFERLKVPLVVATLWPVDSQATAALMTNFHRLRKQAGLSTVAALRAAQVALLHDASQFRHPYYWAAFALVGGRGEF